MNRFLIRNYFGKNFKKIFEFSNISKRQNLAFLNCNKQSCLQINNTFYSNILCTKSIDLNQLRNLSKKGSHKEKNTSKSGTNKNDDTDEDENEEDDNDDDDNDENAEQSLINSIDKSNFKPGFKIILKHVPSIRVDTLLASGLNISRKKIDDSFYASRLRVNGEKVLKKSSPVKELDRVDLIGDVDEKTGKRILKRVFLYKILNEASKKNKPKIAIIVWKSGLFEEDAYKDIYN